MIELKASEMKKQEVEELLRSGMPLADVARRTGVHYNTVKCVWRHMFPEQVEAEPDEKYLETKESTMADLYREWDKVRIQVLTAAANHKGRPKPPNDSNGGRRFT